MAMIAKWKNRKKKKNKKQNNNQPPPSQWAKHPSYASFISKFNTFVYIIENSETPHRLGQPNNESA